MMYILYCFILYLYVGYTYICWIKYKNGAGFKVNEFATYVTDIVDMCTMTILFWPLFILIHMTMVLYERFNLDNIVDKISPNSFYDRGTHDNDPDVQVEKHLLGGK